MSFAYKRILCLLCLSIILLMSSCSSAKNDNAIADATEQSDVSSDETIEEIVKDNKIETEWFTLEVPDNWTGTYTYEEKYNDENLKYNDCYKYAVARNLLYKNDKNIEILVSYKPNLHYFIEWWKQLFGESEGKDGKGIYPSGAEFTTDLHSLGQYIQEGRKNLFETVINVEKEESNIKINVDEDNLDEINYLADKTMDYVNRKAMEGTINAHVEGDVPNIVINMEKIDEETIGHLIYFFELACAMSGKILGVNPFNQPGVEEYKKNMFRLLEKPGYTEK